MQTISIPFQRSVPDGNQNMLDEMDRKVRGLRDAKQLFAWLAQNRKKFPKATGLDLYDPSPTDVIVTTFPKAGTTLTQQLCYQVLVATGGAPPQDPFGTKFADICEVAPWLDFMPQMGVPPVLSSPRVFKTHATANNFDIRRQKHVVVLRDPLKFPGSWLDFTFENYRLDGHSICEESVKRDVFDETVERDLLGLLPSTLLSSGAFGSSEANAVYSTRNNPNKGPMGPWFKHTKDWVDLMEHRNVLILFYENIVKDCATAAESVAAFMGRTLTEDGLNTVVKRCSREYMCADNRFKSILDAKVFGTAETASKVRPAVREGFTGMKIKEKYLVEYRRQMKATFGIESYDELKRAVGSKQRKL
ncbi:Glycolipid sulfotransferase [Chondrus crispus]|uniref:Glycolipid sulfotransferase n=1 Tax=Chondrus crispus TaxID=2769 RepID=R7QHS2_CHOCR|nr:Glycolipid sulfotransferase [Chondrus crispus]CDF38057.1 Glycolipid sulfotransferase [Chondrus crispus]|eukprot:XP_005717926.1 Glycolipid sulfotransferase [Chondrus crispus]